jgi:hypothetical protein
MRCGRQKTEGNRRKWLLTSSFLPTRVVAFSNKRRLGGKLYKFKDKDICSQYTVESVGLGEHRTRIDIPFTEGGSHLTRGVVCKSDIADFRSRRRQDWEGIGIGSLSFRLYGELVEFGLNPVISQ